MEFSPTSQARMFGAKQTKAMIYGPPPIAR